MSSSGLLVSAFGLFFVLAAALNWDFFMEHRKARLFVGLFGRAGARLVYGVLGVVLFVAGITGFR